MRHHIFLGSALLFATAICGTASAQLTLSYISGNTSAASGTGESFTPADAGSFPTASAFLTQMTFETPSSVSFNRGLATYLDIYSNSALTAYVGSSTNSQSWEAGDSLQTKTWSFAALELDKSTTYYAAFSADPITGSVVNREIEIYGSNPYSGGALIYNSNLTPSLDANFSATFNPSAVPEPSTDAAFAGLATLGLVALRRRRLGG